MTTATFLIELPKEPAGVPEKHEPPFEIDRFHAVVDRLMERGLFVLEFVVPHIGDQIHIYCTATGLTKAEIERAFHGAWENIRLTEAGGAAGPALRGTYISTGYLSSKDGTHFLRGAFDGGKDLCAMLFGGLAHVRKFGEEALVQVVLKKGNAASRELEANVRVAVSSGSRLRAEEVFGEIAKGFLGDRGGREWLKFLRPRNEKEFVRSILSRKFDPAERMALAAHELVCLVHLPHAIASSGNVRWARSPEFPIPAHTAREGAYVGEGIYRGGLGKGERRPVRISQKDRERLFISGGSRNDIAKLALHLISGDRAAGKRVVVIDMEGVIAPEILSSLPEEERHAVLCVEADAARPVGLNVVGAVSPHDIAKAIEYFLPLEIQGPLIGKYLRNGLLLLAEDNDAHPATLLDLPRALVDKRYRIEKLRNSKNTSLVRFWEEEARHAEGERILGKLVSYVLSVWRDVLFQEPVRLAVGQARTSIEIKNALDREKSLVVIDLKSSDIGVAPASLLAMLWLLELRRSAAERPFSLFVLGADGNMLDFLATFLSARDEPKVSCVASLRLKTALSLRAEKFIRDPAATHIALRMREPEAQHTAPVFAPLLSKENVFHLEPLSAYVRLPGEQPFKMRVRVPVRSRESKRETAESLHPTLGKNLLAVEKEVARRIRW